MTHPRKASGDGDTALQSAVAWDGRGSQRSRCWDLTPRPVTAAEATRQWPNIPPS